ncbi:MAG: hypothetical protein ACREBG_05590 [Pyrinomonadaceae bacterium]
MKVVYGLVLLISLLGLFASDTLAQDANNAALRLDELRAKLEEVKAKEAELQDRAKQLDEDLKPENIEKSLAGIGSTRPEELRELRRSQLSREKASVLTQLELLAQNRARLESAVLSAEGEAYQESAKGVPTLLEQMMIAQNNVSPRWLVGALLGLVAVLGLGAVLVVRRLKGRQG